MNRLKQDSDSADFLDINWKLKFNDLESKDVYEKISSITTQVKEEEGKEEMVIDTNTAAAVIDKKEGKKKGQKKQTTKTPAADTEIQNFLISNFVIHKGKNWFMKNRGGVLSIQCEKHRNPVSYCLCENTYDSNEFMLCCDNCGKKSFYNSF